MNMDKAKCYEIEGAVLYDTLVNNGIVNEINRTILHPLGLSFVLEDDGTITIYKTTEEAGFLFNQMDTFKTQQFRNFAKNKHIKRQEKYGFIIQTKNVFDAEKFEAPKKDIYKQIYDIFLLYMEQRYGKLATYVLNTFINVMKDQGLTFKNILGNKHSLEKFLQYFLKKKDWSMVSNISFLLEHFEELESQILTAITKSEEENESISNSPI